MEELNKPVNVYGAAVHQSGALIIDDEPDICYLLKQILSRHGIRSSRVESIQEARTMLQSGQQYSIIILDNHLPDGMGVDFAAEIREQYPQARLIMITAHDSDIDRRKARANGVDFFIAKPFSGETISALLTLPAAK